MDFTVFFYIVFSVAMIIIAGSVLFIAIEVVTTLKVFRKILEDVKDTTNDIQFVKNGVKAGILSLAVKLMGKGGEKE